MFFSITLSSGRCILLIHLWVKKTSQYEGTIRRLDLLPWLWYKWRTRDVVHYLQSQLSQLLISPVIHGNLNYVSDTWSIWLEGLVSIDRDGKWIQLSSCISGRMHSLMWILISKVSPRECMGATHCQSNAPILSNSKMWKWQGTGVLKV